jgi:hypothetical protein
MVLPLWKKVGKSNPQKNFKVRMQLCVLLYATLHIANGFVPPPPTSKINPSLASQGVFQPPEDHILRHSTPVLTSITALASTASTGDKNSDELAKVTGVENLRSNAKLLLRNDPEMRATNMLSGAVVALAMIPEAVGFSFVAGISPILGLWTTVVLGFMAGAFGGR